MPLLGNQAFNLSLLVDIEFEFSFYFVLGYYYTYNLSFHFLTVYARLWRNRVAIIGSQNRKNIQAMYKRIRKTREFDKKNQNQVQLPPPPPRKALKDYLNIIPTSVQ